MACSAAVAAETPALGPLGGQVRTVPARFFAAGGREFEPAVEAFHQHPLRPDGVQVTFRVERTPETSFDRYPPDQWTGWEAYLDAVSTAYFENEAP